MTIEFYILDLIRQIRTPLGDQFMCIVTKTGNAGAIWILLMIAFSRLYLYVHYPTDVLGGIVVGGLCGYVGWLLCTKCVSAGNRQKKEI